MNTLLFLYIFLIVILVPLVVWISFTKSGKKWIKNL